MPRTPNPTASELLNQLPATGVPNMPVVLGELLDRLREDFPIALAAINPAIKPPRTADDYRLAPVEPLGDGFSHNIMVANGLDFEDGGIRVKFGSSDLQVFIVDDRSRTGRNIYEYWSEVAAMATTLKTYERGCANDDGCLWKKLEGLTVEGLPEQYAAGYHGVLLTYRMEFQPQTSGWPASLTGTNL